MGRLAVYTVRLYRVILAFRRSRSQFDDWSLIVTFAVIAAIPLGDYRNYCRHLRLFIIANAQGYLEDTTIIEDEVH